MQYRLGEVLKQARKFNFDYSKAEKKIYELSAKIQQTSIAQQIQASKTFHQLWGNFSLKVLAGVAILRVCQKNKN